MAPALDVKAGAEYDATNPILPFLAITSGYAPCEQLNRACRPRTSSVSAVETTSHFSRQRSKVSVPIPTFRSSTSMSAFFGVSNRATAVFLNVC